MSTSLRNKSVSAMTPVKSSNKKVKDLSTSRKRPRNGNNNVKDDRWNQKYSSVAAVLAFLICAKVDSFTPISSRQIINTLQLNMVSRNRNHVNLIYQQPNFEAPSGNDNHQSPMEEYNFWDGPLTATSFNMDLKNLADEKAQKAQDALEIMEDLFYQNRNTSSSSFDEFNRTLYIQPNAACYTTVIDGWLHSSDPKAAYKIQDLLDRLERLHDETANEALCPNIVTYMLVCQAWSDAHKNDFTGEAVERAEAIIQRMKERGIRPDVKVYTSVLFGWCKRAGRLPGAMERAERLLSEMEMGALSKNDAMTISGKHSLDSTRPNINTYTTVISGLSRSKEPNLGFRAEAILERMERNGVEPDMVTYTLVLNCWSKAHSWKEREMAGGRAVSIMKEMERQYAAEKFHVKPNLLTYATGIAAIGNSLDPNAAHVAENVLRHMYAISDSQQITGVKPTTATYNAVITTLARNKKGNKMKCAIRAQELLEEMIQRSSDGEINVQPDSRTWGGVILAWAKCGTPSAANNAQQILDKMQALYNNGETQVQPNVVCYTTVMRAWSNSRRDDALNKAEEILIAMENRFEQTQDETLRPTAISYVTMIDAFIRHDEASAAQRAQITVDRLVRLYGKGEGHIRPNRLIFNALINAWSRSSESGAAVKAEQILQWMETQYRSGDGLMKPDEVTFCGVLNAWANKAEWGGAERAQQILDHMESLSLEERGFKQTVFCHNIVIKAWARSGAPDAVKKMEILLKQLEARDDLHPDATTYSSAINCCAYYKGPAKGKTEAFATAMRMFLKLSQSKEYRPNNITYGTMLKAITKLTEMDQSRHDLVKSLFEACINSGSVDSFVLFQLRGASPDVFRELVLVPLKMKPIVESSIIPSVLHRMPSKWGRNALTNYN